MNPLIEKIKQAHAAKMAHPCRCMNCMVKISSMEALIQKGELVTMKDAGDLSDLNNLSELFFAGQCDHLSMKPDIYDRLIEQAKLANRPAAEALMYFFKIHVDEYVNLMNALQAENKSHYVGEYPDEEEVMTSR